MTNATIAQFAAARQQWGKRDLLDAELEQLRARAATAPPKPPRPS